VRFEGTIANDKKFRTNGLSGAEEPLAKFQRDGKARQGTTSVVPQIPDNQRRALAPGGMFFGGFAFLSRFFRTL
jgi:hypothetical protein